MLKQKSQLHVVCILHCQQYMTKVQKHCVERVRTNLCNVLKAFEQVWLYSSRIFGLGQNLQELII